jgi:phage major head subunit gpT-like protein
MTALRANFSRLYTPGFRAMFFDKYNAYPDEYTELFNILSSDRKYEDDAGITGLGSVPQKDESVGIFYDDPIQGYTVRYTHTTYGLGFRVSREAQEDDMYGPMRKMPSALGRSMRYTVEADAANVYNRAFTSTYAGGDGVQLCSTSHPLVGGSTASNTPSTAADLSEASLEQALIDIAAWVDDRGLLINLRPMKLIVAPAFAWTASKLMGSERVPESNMNAVNVAKGLMPYYVNHYLTDSDAWFILCDGHEVNFFWRRRPDFENGNDFDTEDAKFKATGRWSRGFSDWRGVYGSPGA